MHLAVIKGPGAIKLPFVQTIQEPGREIGGDNLLSP
jgi:hypothetical protein